MESLRQRQASATRSTILRAAQERFERDGYEGTRVEDIAVTAGVAIPTVYKVFTNKRKLLAAVVEAATSGDVAAPVIEQPWWREQISEPSATRQLRLIARNARQIYDRAGLLLELLRSAARADPEVEARIRNGKLLEHWDPADIPDPAPEYLKVPMKDLKPVGLGGI